MMRVTCPQCESENLIKVEGTNTCNDCGWYAEHTDSMWSNHGMHVETIPLNDFYAGQKPRTRTE